MRQQTFQKALSRMTETGFRLFFVACLLFAGLSAIYNVWLCLIELIIILILYLYFQTGISRRKKEVMVYLDHMTSGVDVASRRTMISSPLPIAIFRPDTDDIIWSNERFLHLTGDPDHLFETKLSALVPSFQSQWLLDGDHLSPEPIPVGERLYLVFGNLVCTGGEDEFLATTYWVDVTELCETQDKYLASRPVMAVLLLDNYEDLMKNLTENERSAIYSEINARLDEDFPNVEIWAEPGRFMCGTAVNLITSVIGVTERGGQPWYFLDDGLYGTFSGVIFDQWDFKLISFKEGEEVEATFAGPSCDSLDIMFRGKLTVRQEVGDLLLVPSCGAYTSASATTFNGFSKANFIVWEDLKDEIELQPQAAMVG